MTDRELMQMALDTFNDLHNNVSGYTELWRGAFDREIALLERRLAQPEREWQELTDEEIKRYKPVCADLDSFRAGVKAVEAKLKGKNT